MDRKPLKDIAIAVTVIVLSVSTGMALAYAVNRFEHHHDGDKCVPYTPDANGVFMIPPHGCVEIPVAIQRVGPEANRQWDGVETPRPNGKVRSWSKSGK